MRVLLLCTDSFGGHGGIALYNRDLVRALSSHPRVDEIVVLPRVITNALEPRPPKTRFIDAAARNEASYVGQLTALLRRGRFDLVICGHVNLLPVARLASKAPLLLIYGIEAWKPLRDRLSNALVSNCRAVVSISDLTRERFQDWSAYAGPSFILPNAIHLEQYGVRPKNQELIDRLQLGGKRVVLTVGRISWSERYKGFDEIIDVMPDLVREFPDVVYLIGGGGSDAQRLTRKCADRGITSSVVFTGIFDEAMKPDLYALADVYAMPSRGEGFGFVFLEAMASGVPVIGSRHDGGREALRHGMLGTLVDPSNPAEILTAIREALARGEKRIPEGLELFSFENFVARMHGVLDQTMNDER